MQDLANNKNKLASSKATLPKVEQNLQLDRVGGATPIEAYNIMIDKWSGNKAHPQKDIYTELTKQAFAADAKNTQDSPSPSTRKDGRTRLGKKAFVEQKGDYAVVHFNVNKGWGNTPFLFHKTDTGWKFDMVSQRLLVSMGKAQSFHLQRNASGYADLFNKFSTSMGKDLNLPKDMQYNPAKDKEYAQQIAQLSNALKGNPKDANTLVALAKLNAITCQRSSKVKPLIKQATRLAPNNPEPHFTAAVYSIQSRFKYKNAISQINACIKKGGATPAALDLLGFASLRVKQYKKAIGAFEQSLAMNPDNSYALCKISRAHAGLAYKQKTKNQRYLEHRDKAHAYHQQAQQVASEDPTRTERLQRWLKRKFK